MEMSALSRAVNAFCKRESVELKGKTVLCALSGGRDSMALLHVLTRSGLREGFAVAAAHYNHHLRDTAARDEKFVRAFCAARGISLVVGGGDVRSFAKASGTSIEDAARTMRYRFLEEAAAELGADLVATAHHQQDHAETILMNLLRGTGLQGLCGIPPVRGNIIRPLLDVSREEIDRYVEENSLPYVEDETNADTVYTRNRLRHELLPLLEELSPGSTGRIALAGSRLRYDSDFLETRAAEHLPCADKDDEIRIPLDSLRTEHPAIATRWIRKAVKRLGGELTAPQAEAILSLQSGVIVLSGGLRAAREGAALRFYRLPPPPPSALLSMGEQDWGQYRVMVKETTEEVVEDVDTLLLRPDAQPLTITPWDGTGRLAVENGRRTVKRLLSDHGVPVSRRENLPAIFSGNTLAAVFGAGTDRAFLPMGEKKIVVRLVKRG